MDEVIEMKFEENLRELRKQKGLSQEELAEQLGVTRQAVSKWENGSAYPELDKLMVVCELFHCTMDDLLQGSVKEEDRSLSKEVYDRHENQFAKAICTGVVLILLGASMYCFLEPSFQGARKGILDSLFMVFVTIAALIFIFFGIKNTDFYKKHGKAPLMIYTQAEIDRFQRSFHIAMVVGIGLILVGIALYPLVEGILSDAKASGIFMLMVSAAVGILIYFGMMNSKIEKTQKIEATASKRLGKREMLCGCIMLSATIIYFFWSFVFDAWRISWIVYPIGGMLCGIVYMVLPEDC